MVVGKSLHIHGILVFRLESKYNPEFYATIPPKLASGEIKYSEEVTRGLDKVGDIILAVQTGANKAKAVVIVAEE
jgi:NADPH-dependent curcumin reductase CurA